MSYTPQTVTSATMADRRAYNTKDGGHYVEVTIVFLGSIFVRIGDQLVHIDAADRFLPRSLQSEGFGLRWYLNWINGITYGVDELGRDYVERDGVRQLLGSDLEASLNN
jgi:hypothetical protein